MSPRPSATGKPLFVDHLRAIDGALGSTLPQRAVDHLGELSRGLENAIANSGVAPDKKFPADEVEISLAELKSNNARLEAEFYKLLRGKRRVENEDAARTLHAIWGHSLDAVGALSGAAEESLNPRAVADARKAAEKLNTVAQALVDVHDAFIAGQEMTVGPRGAPSPKTQKR